MTLFLCSSFLEHDIGGRWNIYPGREFHLKWNSKDGPHPLTKKMVGSEFEFLHKRSWFVGKVEGVLVVEHENSSVSTATIRCVRILDNFPYCFSTPKDWIHLSDNKLMATPPQFNWSLILSDGNTTLEG